MPTPPSSSRPRIRALVVAAVVAAAVVLTGLVAVPAAPAAPAAPAPRPQPMALHKGVYGAQPVLSFRGAADPSVLRWAGGYVAFSTGPAAPRATAPTPGGPWTNTPSALLTLPSWAADSRAWASDIDYVNGVYLLYFSVPVAGLPPDGRCIGVATATDPTQTFVPDERPVVCPKQAAAPKAYDRLKRLDRGIPAAGVIDPEMFVDRGGDPYLLYRTQGVPSSIRIVPLPADGRPVGPTVRSSELVRSDGVIENPSLIRKHGQYVLFTSEGNFVGCGYQTTWRRSPDLMDWSGARPKLLLSSSKTGLCGPGGADLGVSPTGHPMLFFHAWTCPQLGSVGATCPAGPDYDTTGLYGAQRSMFAMALSFTKHQRPGIGGYVVPVAAAAGPGSARRG